jgi:hypothetical protein
MIVVIKNDARGILPVLYEREDGKRFIIFVEERTTRELQNVARVLDFVEDF